MLCRTLVLCGLLAASLRAARPPALFSDPARVCDLLAVENFPHAEWHAASYGYECTSTNLRIDYIVSGDDQSRAKRLKLLLDLKYESGDPSERRAEFDRIATKLLTRLGLKAYPELHNAISATRQFRETQPGANITFDPGRRPFLIQTLIVRDASIRVVTIPRSPLFMPMMVLP